MSPSNKPLVWPGGGYLLSFPLLIQKANSVTARQTPKAFSKHSAESSARTPNRDAKPSPPYSLHKKPS